MPRSRKLTHRTSANANTAYHARPRDGQGLSALEGAARSIPGSLVDRLVAMRSEIPNELGGVGLALPAPIFHRHPRRVRVAVGKRREYFIRHRPQLIAKFCVRKDVLTIFADPRDDVRADFDR